MKKFLLVLLIIVLLGGCGAGGWYYYTTQTAKNGISLKLKGTEEYYLWWNPSLTEEEKAEYRWGNSSNDEEFLRSYALEMRPERVADDIIQFNSDYTAKYWSENGSEYEAIYYSFSCDKKEIKLFEDEDNLIKYMGSYNFGEFSIIDGEYWLVYDVYSESYDSNTTIYRFLVKFEQVK